jgi:hypothetical protein
MKKSFVLLSLLLTLLSIRLSAQTPGRANLGLGIGMDYGGFGAQIAYQPAKIFSIFGALGYNLDGAGYNLGVRASFPTEKKVEFHVSGMYGYNAVIMMKDDASASKTYYGPTFAAGIAIKSRNKGNSFLSIELLLPIRSSSFSDDLDILKNAGYDVTEPLPIGFSIGYHFAL